MTIAPIAAADTFSVSQGLTSTTVTGNLGADNGSGVDYDPDGTVLGWVAGTTTSLAGDGDRFLGAFFSNGVLSFLTIQGTVSYPHPVIVTSTAIATAEGGFVILDTSGNFQYTSALGYSGQDSFTYTLVDSEFNFTTTTVTLNVTPTEGANDRPVAIDDAFTAGEDVVISGNLLADNGAGADHDPDGDVLRVNNHTIYSTMGGLVRIYADGGFTYTARAGFSGVDGFDYTVLDPSGAKDVGHVTLTVLAENDPPVAVDDQFQAIHDRTLSGNVLVANGSGGADSDQDGDPLAVVAGQWATTAGGLVTMAADGSFTYQPPARYVGADSFDYEVRDPSGASDIGHVTLNVINRAPVAGTDSYSVGYRGTASGNLLHNDSDPDGDVMTVVPGKFVSDRGSVLTLSANGQFTFKAGDMMAAGFELMTYVVVDSMGAATTGTVQVYVGSHGGYYGTSGDDNWVGTAGNDVAMMWAGDDTADGGDGNDIIGGTWGDDVIYGGLGNDRIYGEGDKDRLFGGGGADRVDGGDGNDQLRGGAGADKFILGVESEYADKIMDFTSADRLVFVAADLGLAAGTLPDASWLVMAGGAVDGTHGRFVFNASTKSLFWDHDGLVATASDLVVNFDTKVTLTVDSFLLV